MSTAPLLEPWTADEGAAKARRLFRERFGSEAEVVTLAPGRVNLIGEHTDYNDGLCLPIALPHATYAAASATSDGQVRLTTAGSGEDWEGGAADLATAEGWAAYVAGVVWALGEAGHRSPGVDVAVAGCVPAGAGLSSSAALECSTGLAVLETLDAADSPALRRTLAEAGIRAENEVAGAATGGMDQTIAVLAEQAHALLLDCRSWRTEQVPFDPEAAGLRLLVTDTRVHHSLNDGGYASRRADCEQAATQLGLPSLREATLEQLDDLADERVQARARHVVTEIERVRLTASALRADDWEEVGRLMLGSHDSMREDFEISVPELDAVVEVAARHGALGARMTGGGFGGSAIWLVPTERADDVSSRIDAHYASRGWRRPHHLVATASGPARRL
ncbi:galactokinase [Nocardioides mangrovicus]|uniref:Galactokinase n=1 Tax=Nocardioides mangrovicus TaxID=2478913 RepID=A0A3L8P124_9ACTN|nr:galactokinase [Nocardioides mangrovicus]RLV48731.1 galactokinase [Nocardioides mangrovicus]